MATLNGTIRTVTIAGNFTNNGTVTLTTGSLTVTAGTFSSSGSLTYTGAGFFKVGGIYPTQELSQELHRSVYRYS
jgi:adhesin HecA-like repeat protein